MRTGSLPVRIFCFSPKTDGARSDRFLQFLRGAEGNLLRRLDLDLLAGRGIAADACGALADLQDAEAADADAVALLQMLGDLAHEIAQDRLALLLGQLMLLGQLSREMLQGNGRSCRRLSSHGWPSFSSGGGTKNYRLWRLDDSGLAENALFTGLQSIFAG